MVYLSDSGWGQRDFEADSATAAAVVGKLNYLLDLKQSSARNCIASYEFICSLTVPSYAWHNFWSHVKRANFKVLYFSAELVYDFKNIFFKGSMLIITVYKSDLKINEIVRDSLETVKTHKQCFLRKQRKEYLQNKEKKKGRPRTVTN